VKEGNIGKNMLRKTRCKFYVSSRNVSSSEPYEKLPANLSAIVKLNAAYSPDPNTENHKFWSATPSGTATLYLYGEENYDIYKPGSFWYIDVWEEEGGNWNILNYDLNEYNLNIIMGDNPGGAWGGNKIELCITNKSAWDIFDKNKNYYAEFIPAVKS
jgi:hypothetical protein